MNWTQSEAIAILAAFTIGGVLTGAYVLWQQGKDLGWIYDENRKLRRQVDELIDWAWDLNDQDLPDGEPTEEQPAVTDEPDDDAPATDVAHAADTHARKWSLLHHDPPTVITEGRHRPEAGGRSVHELIAEAGHEPMRGGKSLPQPPED